MTINELASVLNVSYYKVYRKTRELYPYIFKNGAGAELNEAQATAIKMALTTQLETFANLQRSPKAATNLEKELVIQQAMVYQQEIINDLRQELESTKDLLNEREEGLEHIQRIAERGGLITSDREDMLALYRRRK